jgi:uncharacterized protein (TIGR03437 family)
LMSLPMRFFRALPFLFVTGCALAQPFIPPRSILNAASYMQPGLPSGALARGSMFSIFGRNLGPATPAQAASFPLPAALQNVSIRVTQGTQSVDVYPIYVSATQINAILPSNAPLGAASLQLTYNGVRSNQAPVRIAANAPGLFTATGYGAGPGIFQNYVSATEQPINSALNAAKPGQIVTLWGTGLGAISAADNVAPPVGNLVAPVQVHVGGKVVTRVLYSGRAPCCAAVDQIVFEVPADAPEGCFVPVHLKAGDAVSNAVTIAVGKDGGTCTDGENTLSTAMAAGKKTGLALATRVRMRADTSVPVNRDFTGDFAAMFLHQQGNAPFNYDPIAALPPAGTCSTYTVSGDLMGGAGLQRFPGRNLEAGAVTISGTRGPITLTGNTLLGVSGELPGAANLPLFFGSGAATIRGAGGADLGVFNVALDAPAGVNWTNRDALTIVDRNAPLTFRFTGAGTRSVLVGGVSVDLPTNTSGMFLCSVPSGAETFTVPAIPMSNLPAGRGRILRSPAAVFVGVISDRKSLTATGLDVGTAISLDIQSKTVIFR